MVLASLLSIFKEKIEGGNDRRKEQMLMHEVPFFHFSSLVLMCAYPLLVLFGSEPTLTLSAICLRVNLLCNQTTFASIHFPYRSNERWVPMSLLLVHRLFFLSSFVFLLTNHHDRPRTPCKTCSFGYLLTQLLSPHNLFPEKVPPNPIIYIILSYTTHVFKLHVSYL